MMLSNDITSFMQWWLTQIINIIRFAFETMASIEFMGTNLLEVIIAINIIAVIIKVFMTIQPNWVRIVGNEERRK